MMVNILNLTVVLSRLSVIDHTDKRFLTVLSEVQVARVIVLEQVVEGVSVENTSPGVSSKTYNLEENVNSILNDIFDFKLHRIGPNLENDIF